MILYPDFTISLGNQEKVGSFLTLANNNVLRKIKQSYDIIYQKIDDVLVVAENGVAFNRVEEDMLGYLKS